MTGPRINRLLASLPPGEAVALSSETETVELRRREVLWAPGDLQHHVYFPVSAGVALIVGSGAGRLDTGIVGSEGMVGLEAFLGGPVAAEEAMAIIPGVVQRIPADVFARLSAPSTVLHQVLSRYACARIGNLAHSALCDATHSIRQRCVRRLLTMHDCAGTDHFPVTQQSLSTLLGVRRASVSVAAEKLQDAGLILYEHGRMHIADRAGLESQSCSCYRQMKEHAERLLPETVAR